MTGLPNYPDAQRSPIRGRRERSMQDKQVRIFTAAAALFTERGFDAVGTQEIAERADVAVGTVFRYVSSKAELLLMVYNRELRDAIDTGVRAAAAVADPVESVDALVQAVLASSARNPANVIAYQRELLFGSATDEHRTAGLALVGELEDAIASRLATAARSAGVDGAPVLRDGHRAARTVFAALSLLLAGPSTGAHSGVDPIEELRGQVTQVVRGFLVTLPSIIETHEGD